mmetsp:Transcript_183/g.586  ORF Transcript_183/g.586 Transcript_183/m.586 type:complete len:302 (-) Transcript_183:650-1555(-)
MDASDVGCHTDRLAEIDAAHGGCLASDRGQARLSARGLSLLLLIGALLDLGLGLLGGLGSSLLGLLLVLCGGSLEESLALLKGGDGLLAMSGDHGGGHTHGAEAVEDIEAVREQNVVRCDGGLLRGLLSLLLGSAPLNDFLSTAVLADGHHAGGGRVERWCSGGGVLLGDMGLAVFDQVIAGKDLLCPGVGRHLLEAVGVILLLALLGPGLALGDALLVLDLLLLPLPLAELALVLAPLVARLTKIVLNLADFSALLLAKIVKRLLLLGELGDVGLVRLALLTQTLHDLDQLFLLFPELDH